MLNIGMMGLSPGNGHPYSFSAIFNGFQDKGMAASGWDNIYDYLRNQDPADFGIAGARISHIWTQDRDESARIARAANIENIVNEASDMIGEVDAVILARDDFANHLLQSRPFLEAGVPIFIDKPLSLDVEELSFFRPFLLSGKLYSCSGIRYAKELDWLRANKNSFGKIKLARGAVVKNWDTYAIHMLDGIFSVVDFSVVEVCSQRAAEHSSVVLTQEDGSVIQIDALQQTAITFQMDFWSSSQRFSADVKDFFTAFRRSLWHFVQMVQTGCPQISPDLTINLMKVLIAGRISENEGRPVKLASVTL